MSSALTQAVSPTMQTIRCCATQDRRKPCPVLPSRLNTSCPPNLPFLQPPDQSCPEASPLRECTCAMAAMRSIPQFTNSVRNAVSWNKL